MLSPLDQIGRMWQNRNTTRHLMKCVVTASLIAVGVSIMSSTASFSCSAVEMLSEFDQPSNPTTGFTRQQLQNGKIDVVQDPARASNMVARMVADGKKRGRVGKADLIKAFSQTGAGHTVEMQARFFAPTGTALNSIILMDLECADCGLDTNPGIRLYLRDRRVRVDRSKIGIKEPFVQNANFKLSNNQWHHIVWRVELGKNSKGRSRVTIDDQLVMDASGTTLLTQEIVDKHADIRVREAVDRFQVGLTANSNKNTQSILMDSIRFCIR